MTLTLLSDKIFRPKSLRSFHPSIHPSLGNIQGTHCAHRKDPPKEETTVGLEGSQKSSYVTCTCQPPGLGHPRSEQLESASPLGHTPSPAPQRFTITLHDASPSSSCVLQWSVINLLHSGPRASHPLPQKK